MDAPSLLVENLGVIEQIISSICRRRGMDVAEIEEFAAEVKLRLVIDDYAILRAFGGRSRFETYIAAVVHRLLLDHRRHQWGKWRPSAEAKHLGKIATDLERMIYRDGRAFDEAVTVIRGEYPTIKVDELRKLADQLPARMRHRRVSLDELELEQVPDANAVERSDVAARISDTVSAFINQLTAEDQLILRLRFDSEMTVAQIARAIHIDQPVLYRRLRKTFDQLRSTLVAAGVSAQDVEGLIGDDSAHLDFHLARRGETTEGGQPRRVIGHDAKSGDR